MAPEVRVVETFLTAHFRASLYRQRPGAESWQQVLLMVPLAVKGRVPGVVVPFYDPDRMCGYNLQTK